jgi:hypothetical protein
MAFGVGEDPALSPATHIEGVEFPAWRDAIVRSAADGGAPAEVINLFKALPRGKYETADEVTRDLSEASRRMAMGQLEEDDGVDRDRRNLGIDAMQGEGDHP